MRNIESTVFPLLLGAVFTYGCAAHSPRIFDDDAGPDADGDTPGEDAPSCLEEAELCDDGIDNDCDGLIDELCDPDQCPPGIEVPYEEVCDGIDNDCDGLIDEDCTGRCYCHPLSWRYCDDPIYDAVGALQYCDADGEHFGPCEEGDNRGPVECREVSAWYSPAYEQCLIYSGYCAQDMWDLDRDGDTSESLGSCFGITCTPEEEERCGDLFDNDLDGLVDETCEDCLCVPGSIRYCDSPVYSTIGTQNCDDDGGDWGPCLEDRMVDECIHLEGWYSPNVELCMIAHNFCVQDMWDADGDGDTWESLGTCVNVLCGPPRDEICENLFDDDQDGHIDEDCGDCECSVGTWRWCDTPTHGRVGLQQCDDVEGEWGQCVEVLIPDACQHIDGWYSTEMEECLIENEECAQDMWDLDDDGNHWESLGDCPDVICHDG